MVPVEGFEPPIFALRMRCITPMLHRHDFTRLREVASDGGRCSRGVCALHKTYLSRISAKVKTNFWLNRSYEDA